MLNMKQIRGMLWDFDGVIVDSEDYKDRYTAKVLEEKFGVEFKRDMVKPIIAGKPPLEANQTIIAWHGLNVNPKELEDLRKVGNLKGYREEIGFIEGWEQFYADLRTELNLPSAIATSCNGTYFHAIDDRLKITGLFNGNIIRHDMIPTIAASKPHPAIFGYAAKEFLRMDLGDCIGFEDAPNGIAALLTGGAKAIGVGTTFDEHVLIQESSKLCMKDLKENPNYLFIPDYSADSLQKVVEYAREN